MNLSFGTPGELQRKLKFLQNLDLVSTPYKKVLEFVNNPAANLAPYVGRQVTLLGYIITMKPVRTSKGEGMLFGTFIDASGNWLDTVSLSTFC